MTHKNKVKLAQNALQSYGSVFRGHANKASKKNIRAHLRPALAGSANPATGRVFLDRARRRAR
jgi:hypothetical protein